MRKLIYRLVKSERYKLLSESRKNKTLSSKELNKLREKRFSELIQHAKIFSPYYRELLSEKVIKDINDLKNLPILTKEIIKTEGKRIKSISKEDLKYLQKNSTSGSTGEATIFFSDI